jgi:hypothetical protein
MKKRFAIAFSIGLFIIIDLLAAHPASVYGLLAAPMALSALAGRCNFMKRVGLLIDLFSASAN